MNLDIIVTLLEDVLNICLTKKPNIVNIINETEMNAHHL